MAEPQADGYDTQVTLRFARLRYDDSRRANYGESSSRRGPRIFDDAVVVRHYDTPYRHQARLANGPLRHPNIDRAVELVRLWPEAYAQFKALIHAFNPLIDPQVAEQRWVLGSGSSSHCHRVEHGVIYATIFDPFGLAQSFVHEMAHTKLFALGIWLTRSEGLITNPAEAVYDSPIILDRKRPMPAVFHAVYSFIHVTALDIVMLKHASSQAERRVLLRFLRRNVARMEQGIAVLKRDLQVDSNGRVFVDGFLEWAGRVVDDGNEILAGAGASCDHPS